MNHKMRIAVLFNKKGTRYLKSTAEYIPGKSYHEDDVDIKKFRGILEVIKADIRLANLLQPGKVAIYAGPYGFTKAL